jgi:hypothetical protein
MQKFDDVLLEKIFGGLEIITEKISLLLSAKEFVESDDINNISELYKKRKLLLNNLDTWFQNENSKKYVNLNLDLWGKRLDNLIQNDKENVAKIENNTKNIGNKLRELIKKKSLLVYTKERLL